MIKILWNQCEAETKRPGPSPLYAQALSNGYGGPPLTETVQCERFGVERTFADSAKHIMCDQHWNMCTGIVDKDGAKHMKGEGEAVG